MRCVAASILLALGFLAPPAKAQTDPELSDAMCVTVYREKSFLIAAVSCVGSFGDFASASTSQNKCIHSTKFAPALAGAVNKLVLEP